VLLLVRRDVPRRSFSAPYVPLLLAAGVCAIWIPWRGAEGSALAADLALLSPPGRWAWIAVRVAGSCLVIPLVEELAFRGFLLPWLASPRFEEAPPRQWTWLAVILSSAAFGGLHERWLLGTVAGLAFAAARLHRGRLGDAVLAHALCNLGIAATVLLGGRWDLWS
jgi:CAAX prenyl protease-like protein